MCSITDQAVRSSQRDAALAVLVAHHAEIGAQIAQMLRDRSIAGAAVGSTDGPTDRLGDDAAGDVAVAPVDLGGLPPDLAADLAVTLLRSGDQVVAAGTVLAGHVAATATAGGSLVAGVFASPRRWLEKEARLGEHSARAVLARARALREHSAAVADSWLTGSISADSVRELTSGVTSSLARVKATRAEKQTIRADALAILLPLAQLLPPGAVKRAVQRLQLVADPDGATQAAMEAYDDQSLTCVQVGSMSVITAHLTHENAAAVMTAVDSYTRRIVDRDPAVVHDPACPLDSPAPAPGKSEWCAARVAGRGEAAHGRIIASRCRQ